MKKGIESVECEYYIWTRTQFNPNHIMDMRRYPYIEVTALSLPATKCILYTIHSVFM